MNKWCAADADPANTLKKDPLTRCAPSTWNVKIEGDMSDLLTSLAVASNTCPAAEWGLLANGVSYDDMNTWDVSKATDMNVRPPPAPRGKRGRW